MWNKEKLRILHPQSENKLMFDLSYKSQSKQLHLYRLQMVEDSYGPCQRYRPQTSITQNQSYLWLKWSPSVGVAMTSLVSLGGFHAQASRSAPGYTTACWKCSGSGPGRAVPAGAAAGCAWGGKPAKVVSVRLADGGAGLAWAMALHLCVCTTHNKRCCWEKFSCHTYFEYKRLLGSATRRGAERGENRTANCLSCHIGLTLTSTSERGGNRLFSNRSGGRVADSCSHRGELTPAEAAKLSHFQWSSTQSHKPCNPARFSVLPGLHAVSEIIHSFPKHYSPH